MKFVDNDDNDEMSILKYLIFSVLLGFSEPMQKYENVAIFKIILT